MMHPTTRYVLKLFINRYGLKQGGCNFYEKMNTEITNSKRGFVQSQFGPCFFYTHGIIVLCYVDDCIIFTKDQQSIKNLILSLQEDCLCADEGLDYGFLGVEIKDSEEGTILHQTQLTHRIIELLHLTDAKSTPKPAVKPLLSKNIDGKERLT